MHSLAKTNSSSKVGILALALLAALTYSQPALAAPNKAYTVKLTVKKGNNLSLLLVGKGGSLLASAPIKSDSQVVSLKTKSVSTIAGATLQMVSGTKSASSGEYFGPVILAWKGNKLASASRVYMKLKSSVAAVTALGVITVKRVTRQQGYAAVAASSSAADASISSEVKAAQGKPLGVGNYGKLPVAGAKAHQAADPPNQPGGPSGGMTEPNKQLGGDLDKDGLPNAFDVNDDGDSKTDSADNSTPMPVATDDTSATCASVDFRIFTNFKATQPGFAGTINAYGPGPFAATSTSVPEAMGKTMSMVFSSIRSVCGSQVVKTELKGVGVAYAPSDYVDLGAPCESTGDYQWTIGNGRLCGSRALTAGYVFSASDIPSGQDTFAMRITTSDGKIHEFTSSPGFVFVTNPMVVGYGSGSTLETIDYSANTPGPDGPRVNSPSIPLNQGDTLDLKLFRPQRLAIDGEAGFAERAFYDLGGFRYTPDLPNGPGKCDALTTTDTTMPTDTASNKFSPPMITLSWPIGTRCYGVPPRNTQWTPGELPGGIDIQVEPSGPGGNAAQKLFITAG